MSNCTTQQIADLFREAVKKSRALKLKANVMRNAVMHANVHRSIFLAGPMLHTPEQAATWEKWSLVEREFHRQVYMCSGIGVVAMGKIIDEEAIR